MNMTKMVKIGRFWVWKIRWITCPFLHCRRPKNSINFAKNCIIFELSKGLKILKFLNWYCWFKCNITVHRSCFFFQFCLQGDTLRLELDILQTLVNPHFYFKTSFGLATFVLLNCCWFPSHYFILLIVV